MWLIDLTRTTTFRVAIVYLILFSGTAFALFTFVAGRTEAILSQDIDVTIDAESQAIVSAYVAKGGRGEPEALEALKETIVNRSARAGGGVYLLADERGTPVVGNLDEWPGAPVMGNDWIDFTYQRLTEEGRQPREARARRFRLDPQYQLLAGRDVTDRRNVTAALWNALMWAGAIATILGVAGGILVSLSVLRRIEAINRTSAEIMRGDLSRRVPVRGGGDELTTLATNLNAMFQQIERLMAGLREVSDNIAHDLRTPLTRMRNRLELALLRETDAAEGRRIIEATILEADRLIATFNALLTIAEAEAGSSRGTHELVALSALARDVAELYEPVAEEKGIALTLDLAPDGLAVLANRSLLSQALANLIDNAIKYTPPGGRVAVETAPDGDGARLTVRDSGAGIPPEDRERVLQRFVRLESHRSSPGSGLGLSLVQAVAQLHDATITLGDAGPGLVITMLFGSRTALAAPSDAVPQTA